MDENLSTILEGTRQFFQGLPIGSNKDGKNEEHRVPSSGNGGPSPETASPPSAAHPQDPLEPEPHIIHKATVMQQAQRQQAQAQAQALIERPSSANLISPPPHIIRKPQPAISEESRSRYNSHIPTPPAPARYSPHIPAQPPPTPLYHNRAQPQRSLTVLEARRPSPVQAVQRPFNEDNHRRLQEESSRSLGPPPVQKDLQELHPHRQYEPTPAPAISQDQRHMSSVPNHYLEHRKSSPLTAQHSPAMRSTQPNQSNYPGYPSYPPQNNVDTNLRSGGEADLHASTTRTYPTIHSQARTGSSTKLPSGHIYQEVPQQAYNHKIPQQPTQPPASYQRTRELYNSQMNHKAPSSHTQSSLRNAKPLQTSEYNYNSTRMPSHKTQSNHLGAVSSMSNYQDRVPALNVDQRQVYPNTQPSPHSNSRSSHVSHAPVMSHSVHPDTLRPSSGVVEMSDHQHSRVPPIHPHHQPSRVPADYPPQQSKVPSNQYGNEQYHQSSSSNNIAASSNYQLQSYSSASKSSYGSSAKHMNTQSRVVASKPSPLPHQQKMTVSVTSIVNQMKQTQCEPSASTTHRNKKESPLDLSVKTVRIPADSTAKDEIEGVFDKREGIIRHSSAPSAMRENPTTLPNNRQMYQDKQNNVGASSHKVDFMPNFNTSGHDRSHEYREQSQAYLSSRQSNPYERPYSKQPDPRSHQPKIGSQPDSRTYNHQYESSNKYPYSSSSYSKRIDTSLPKIDLTISLDDERERMNHSHAYNKEISRRREEESRKRDASHIPNHIPPKVARYESWDIDRHGRILEQQQREAISASNHYVTNGATIHSNSNQRKPYEYNHSNRKSENIEPHSSKYYQPSAQPSRPQNDLYYQHNTQKPITNHHAYEYQNIHDKSYPTTHDLQASSNHTQYGYQNSASPADKRVLSILRNSLGAKNPEIQKTAETDDCIIIQDDNEPPSIDLTEYQPKKIRYMSESRLGSVPPPNNLPHKMRVPRAVDSIKYDSDSSQKSIKGREEVPSPIPIKTETTTYTVPMTEHVQVEIDIAARIRTKAELKGFVPPVVSSEHADPVAVEIKNDINVLSVIKTDSVPPQLHRRRLFSRDNNDESKKESSVIRNSSESSVFDFPGGDSESEAPVLEKRPINNSGKENISENIKNTTEVEKVINIKCEPETEDDPYWAETCNSFLEELQSGRVKKNKKRKCIPTNEDDPIDNNNEIIQSDIKIEKSVIISVKGVEENVEENSPLLVTKIKEEVEDTIEEVTYDTDSSDENVPLIQKIKKEKNVPEKNEKMGLKCPFIKLEKNPNLMNSVKTTVKLSSENTYSFKNKSNDEEKVSSDDERLSVKKRKQEMLKNNKEKSDTSDSDSEVISKLRNRKVPSNKASTYENVKTLKETIKEELKLKEEIHTKKPGFGDGSGFGPGWENEVYNYKRSLRMPARLIHVSRPPHLPRVSSSLPDLDPCPHSPAPSTSTEELFTQKKLFSMYSSTEKLKQDADSDLESLSSYVVPKTNYDSEASCSTTVSTTSKGTKKPDGSFLDVLIKKCGNKELRKKKNKEEDTGPKLIPKSDNPMELLATPSLGLEKSNVKGNKNISKEKVMEEAYYLGSFRKKTVSTFRDAFISNTDGVLGATEEFSPVVLKTRTRTETRVLKKRATMKEVFGDERPASAPPVACTEDIHVDVPKEIVKPMEIKVKEEIKKPEPKDKDDVKVFKKKDEVKPKDSSKPKEENKVLVKKVKKNPFSSSVRDGLRGSQLSRRNDSTGRMLRIKKRNNLINMMSSKKIKKVDGSACPKIKKEPITETTIVVDGVTIKKEPVDSGEPVKKRFKRLINRRKLSSGFDYIRNKKKKLKKDVGVIKKRNIIPRPSPESVHDIQKEIKNWIIKKSVGETVLHRAARLGYIDCVAYCLEKMDVPPSCRDNAGYTPLHEACSRGHLDIARLLLQYGADVSEAAQGGIRPLHEACENGYIEIIRLLLSYGADPLLATYSGQSPISLSTGSCVGFLQLHLNDVQGNVPQPWHFNGPCRLLDPIESGFDPLASPPPSPTPPPSPPQDFICSLAPHPPLYRLRPSSPTQQADPTLWCLLQDLATILQVKSRDALLKQVHCGPGVPRDSLKELKMKEFLDRAQCQQFLAAGEKINICASKIALVRYTDKVKQLLNIESVTVR